MSQITTVAFWEVVLHWHDPIFFIVENLIAQGLSFLSSQHKIVLLILIHLCTLSLTNLFVFAINPVYYLGHSTETSTFGLVKSKCLKKYFFFNI